MAHHRQGTPRTRNGNGKAASQPRPSQACQVDEKRATRGGAHRGIDAELSAPGTGISASLPDIVGKSVARTDKLAQSSLVRPRSFLEKERCDFSVSRRTLEPSVGRLGRRVLVTIWARAISSS